MSIVTTAAAVPSRLLTLFATLADSENGELRERLESWATPPSLASRGGGDDGEASSALLTTTLQEARRLGLVAEEDGRLRLGSSVPRKKTKGGDREAEFRAYMIDLLFSEDRAEESGQAGFALALAWFLARDPREPLSFGQPPQDLLRNDIGKLAGDTELTNLNRYQNFLYWARYLGFATMVGDGEGRRVIPDPSRAISGALDRLFGKSDGLDIEPFMDGLSAIFPVLEDGNARTIIEDARQSPSADRDTLSVSTSLALLRLAERGEIILESVADARARILNFGGETGRVSKVRRGKIK